MTPADAQLEHQLQEARKQLSHPPRSIDELLSVLDVVKAETCPKEEVDLTVVNMSPKAVPDTDTIIYDESLVGTKVKVWWPEDKMYYEGVVSEFYPARKMHKISYVDGDVEIVKLRKERWEIVMESSVQNDEEQNTEVQSEEGAPEIHKKKKSKTDPAESQEMIIYSAKKVGGVSSSGKSKHSTQEDDTSAQKNSGKSKEDEETLKTSSKTKKVNESKGKTASSITECNTNSPIMTEKMDYDKEKEERKLHLEDKRLRLEAEKLRIKAEKGKNKVRQEDERLRLEDTGWERDSSYHA